MRTDLKKYEEPTLSVAVFDSMDVVTASGEGTPDTVNEVQGILENKGVNSARVIQLVL